jgi:hypothetical protein
MSNRRPVSRVWADFNGLFGDVLCLTHDETGVDEHGERVTLAEGMSVVAFDDDADEGGRPAYLVAWGVVARPPAWLEHSGSRWVLMIGDGGVTHASELPDHSQAIQRELGQGPSGPVSPDSRRKIRGTWNRKFPGGHILAFDDHSYLVEFGSDRKPPLLTIGWCRWYPCSLDLPRRRRR